MRESHLRIWPLLFVALGSVMLVHSQNLFFRRLGIKDGFTSSVFWHTTLDKNGFIWLASVDGLFFYDGYETQHFTRETHPQLPSNAIGYLFCDNRNRIWIQTSNGIAMMDENRRLHTIDIPGYDKKEAFGKMILQVPGQGIVAISPLGSFVSPDGVSNWKPYTWLNGILNKTGVVDVKKYDEESLLLSIRYKRVLLINFKKQKVICDLPVPGVMGLCKLNDDELLAGTDDQWGLYRISIKEKKIIKQYPAPLKKNGKALGDGLVMMDKAADGLVYITTRREGLLRFDPDKETVEQFVHEPNNEHSITSNALRMIATDDKGAMVIAAPYGANFTNVNYSVMQHQTNFRDEKGNWIDESVNGITSDAQGNIYLATAQKLLKWSRQKGITTVFRNVADEDTKEGARPVPYCVEMDASGKLWAGFNDGAIIVYSKEGEILKTLIDGLPSTAIRTIRKLHNGQMMIGTENGLFAIHSTTYALDTFLADTALLTISKKRIVDILSTGREVWFAISPNGGFYQYDYTTKKLTAYNEKNGLALNRGYCLAADKQGNIYAGTRAGLSIIDKNGKITNLDKTNGLLNSRVEAIETDQAGRIWFTNNNSMGCYNPLTKKITYYDDHNGITNTAFNIGPSHVTPQGELFFGTTIGVINFQPEKVKPYTTTLKLFLYRTQDGKNFIRCDKDSVLQFPYKEGKVNFLVSGSDIISNAQLFYRYKMEGLDTGWSEPTHTRSIAYNLHPGKYSFRVQASYDRIHYVATTEAISLVVAKPFWQTLWFLIACLLVTAVFIWWLFRNRVKSIRKKSLLQQQMAELEAKALRAQMNPHFIFNSLNAIQECIVTGKTDAAFEYLSKFSRLLRLVLNNSEKNFISLSSELEMIRLYLSLESLRFRQSFSYFIDVGETIDTDEIQVPALLIQPFVENAVWHGLRMKEGEKKLWIRFMVTAQQLKIEIEDNGIGREKAAAIKKQKLGAEQFESKGTALSQQRISLLNRQAAMEAKVEIIDLADTSQRPGGTKVIIQLPFNTQKLIPSKPFEHAKNTDH